MPASSPVAHQAAGLLALAGRSDDLAALRPRLPARPPRARGHMTAALRTVEQLKAALQAARAHQVYVEDHTAAEDHDTSQAVADAREATDLALGAVLDAIRPRMP